MKTIFKIFFGLFLLGRSVCYSQEFREYNKLMSEPQANYYSISAKIDSVLQISVLNTSEDNEAMAFSRWTWFWERRMGDAIDQCPVGKFTHYYDLMNSLSQLPVCTTSSPHPADWNLLGPIQLPKQEMGRIDAIARDPNNTSVVYAGSANSGLWRTNNIDAAVPVWENITDNTHLPGLGIADILVDPSNSDVIYIATGILSWEGGDKYGVGVLKTTNGTSNNPIWQATGLSYNPSQQTVCIRKLRMHPSNHNVIYAISDKDVYKTIDGGNSWPSCGLYSISGGINLNLGNIVFDPLNNSNFLVSGDWLWRWDNSNSQWTDITLNLVNKPSGNIRLSVSGNKIYALYYSSISGANEIDVSTDGGLTWTIHTFTNMRGDHFIVSSANPSIMYIGDGKPNTFDRVIFKSINGGSVFNQISYYNGNYHGTSTHADIRALNLVSPSSDGLQDVLLAGTDGGVLYSTDAVAPDGSVVNWVNANGTGLSIGTFYGLSNSEIKPELVTAGAQDNGFATYNNFSWSNDNSNIGDAYQSIIDNDNTDVCIGENISTASQYLSGLSYLKKSLNGGQSWPNTFQKPAYGNQSNPDNVGYSPDAWNVKSSPLFNSNDNTYYLGFHDLFYFNHSSNTWVPMSDFTAEGVIKSSGCGAFAIAPSNSDVIYFGFELPTYDGSNCEKKKLWKTIDGGTTWTDVTNNLPVNWAGITGIAVDPQNPDRVWVSIGNIWNNPNAAEPYNGYNRVCYSGDGGNTWMDYSKGLTPLPVNTIVLENGFSDALYIGTDIGVFYTDRTLYNSDDPTNSQNIGWVCYSDGFPPCIVTDLKINYATNTLRAATFGRGIWETDLSCDKSHFIKHITQNTTWNYNLIVDRNVIVENGATLIIPKNTVVGFVTDAKLIVEPGATLIVDGSKLTSACGSFWQGIELQGNSSLSQLTPGAQGQVILKNGAVIENAMDGITTIGNLEDAANWDWSKTGGIIKAENSTFRNCRRGIQFLTYNNVHPTLGSSLPNLSTIRNCTFETTKDLPDGIRPYAFISMNEVNGVKLYGNTFQNTNPSANLLSLGMGIYSINASYTVDQICLSPTIPCSNAQKSRFINLHYGIRSSSTPGLKAVTVKNTVFDLCHFGVYFSGMEYPTVINNDFIVDDYTFHMMTNEYGYGLYLNQCNGFQVEGNDFMSPTSGNRGWTGIYVNNSNTGNGANSSNEIYRNTFTDLYSGIVALNDNDGLYLSDGLKFNCETFNGNTYDISVLPKSNPNIGISAVQGLYFANSFNAKTLSRNWYSATCTGDENQFKIDWYSSEDPTEDPTKAPIEYPIMHANYSGAHWQPECYDPMLQTYSPPLIDNITYSSSDCPDRTILNPIAIRTELQVVSTKKEELNNLIDGGQTNLLVSIAQSNIPEGQMLQTMLEFSPYLSDEVLLTLIERPNALSPGTMQQILAANSPLSDDVYQAVQAMQTPLPKGIRNQIAALQTSEMSDRDQLPYGIAYYEYTEKVLESDLVRYYLNDTLTVNPMDSVMNILEQATTKNSKLNLVSAYISSRHFAKANQTLDSLVNIDADLVSYSEKQRMNILTADLPGKELSLLSDSSKMQVLQSIANDTLQYGAVYAKNTLELLNDTLFAELTLIPMPETDNRSMIAYSSGNQPEIEKGLITCYPNPASEKFTVHYEVESACTEMFLVIHNVMGKEVSRIRVNECIGDVELSSPSETGTYYVYIESCGQYIAIDKIVVTR